MFSVDYNDELDTLVSGSADYTVKVWALSAGACLNTLTGHTEWVTKVSVMFFFENIFCQQNASLELNQFYAFQPSQFLS